MAAYEPPVDRLLRLGRPMTNHWEDYTSLGIGPEHIPELLRLLQDKELAWPEEDTPTAYCQLHAWRALGQMKAEAAIEPLLDLLAEQESDDWVDWITEDVPEALGEIGPPALVPTAKRMEKTHTCEHAPWYYGDALVEIAKRNPETRDEVIRRLMAFLEHASDNDASMNGFIIGNLLDLKAVDAWLVIEKTFGTGNVDDSIVGGLEEVRFDLGLGPKPPSREFQSVLQSRLGFSSAPAPLSAKDRAQKRAKKEKAAKRKKKRGR